MNVRTTAVDIRAGIRVEWLTIVWMTFEALVSIGAGLAARSIALIGFGVDSVIELISAGILLWRLRLEPVGAVATTSRGQSAERQASRIVGWSLVLLAVYVAGRSAYNLWTHSVSESSPVGIAMAVATLFVMPWLIRTKRKVASAISSPALRGDAACGVVCVYMATTLLAGLVLQAVFGWWWADPVAALGIVYFIVREGREVLAAQSTPDCCA
ncbi:MAG TPA: cation transporter [bacterium]|nr:cation transporter [bacterium]